MLAYGFDEIAYQTGAGRLLRLMTGPFGNKKKNKKKPHLS
jgi:hypothetical protein